MNPGDVVQLKSGGPRMTAAKSGQGPSHHNELECLWFEGTELKRGWFARETLKAVPEPAP